MHSDRRAPTSPRSEQARSAHPGAGLPGSPAHAPRSLLAVAALALTILIGAFVAPQGAGADQLGDKRAQAQQVASKLDDLQSTVDRLDAQNEKAKGELEASKSAVADAQRRADEANAELEQRQGQLRSFAVDAYVTGNDSSAMDALLTSDANDAPKVKGYLAVTTGNRQDLVDALAATKKKAEDEGQQLADAQAELESRNAALEASLQQAQDAVDEQAAIKSKLDGEIAQLVAEDQARKAAEAQQRAAEQARQQAAAAPSTTAPAAGNAPAPPPKLTAPAPAPSLPPPPVGDGAAAAVAAAMSRIGAPYVWAAAGPDSFDCSGLTAWAWGQAGRSLPHYSGAQYAMSRRISAGEAQPGDLVFFWAPGDSGDPGHVGLYIGGGQFVHAPGRGKFVRVDSVGYWSGARVAYGRI